MPDRAATSNPHIKSKGQLLGRIACIVVAGLVLELAVNGVGAGGSFCGSDEQASNNEVAGVDAQLGAGIKGEAHQLAGGILHFSHSNLSGKRKMELRWDKFLLKRFAGIDVVWLFHAKGELHRRGVAG